MKRSSPPRSALTKAAVSSSRRVCGQTSPTFLISPLLAVWKLVPSDRFIPLQRHTKFRRESKRRMRLLPLHPQSAITLLQPASPTERGEGGLGKGGFSTSLKRDCRSSSLCFNPKKDSKMSLPGHENQLLGSSH